MVKKNIIAPIKNGPLHITGELELRNSAGGSIEKAGELYLCRCGKSNNKPYCDGEHKKQGYQDTAKFIKPPESESELLNEGLLELKVQANGPLIFRGPACIRASDHQQIFRKVGGLCRCGQSGNSPFCDGTHAKVEFVAE